MAGGGHGASSHNATHGGLSHVGQGMCTVMWFWVFYRAKQDGPVLMGWCYPWEGHGHGGHDEEAKGLLTCQARWATWPLQSKIITDLATCKLS